MQHGAVPLEDADARVEERPVSRPRERLEEWDVGRVGDQEPDVHAILRRSRPYGRRIPDRYQDDQERRGIFFICLNSDLERQFEFIQQSWLGNPVFGGLNGERDPLVGNADGQGVMTVHAKPDDPVRTRIQNLKSFVTVRGGAYFFMPGIPALRYLAGLAD